MSNVPPLPSSPSPEESQALNAASKPIAATASPIIPEIQRLNRSAAAAIDGFRYQALVAVKHLLFLQDNQRLILERSEDLEIHTDLPPGNPSGYMRAEYRVQVKNTTSPTLRWSDERLYVTVLEFFIQFARVPQGVTCTFALVTPASIGGSKDAVLAQWRQLTQFEGHPQFLSDLRTMIECRITALPPGNLKQVAQQTFDRCTPEQWLAFAKQVQWPDLEKPPNVLAVALTTALEARAKDAGLSSRAALSLLVENILYRSTRPDEERILDNTYVKELLRASRDDRAEWERFSAFTDLIGKSNANIQDQLSSAAATRAHNHEELKALLAEILEQKRQEPENSPEVRMSRHAALTPPAASPFTLGDTISGHRADADVTEHIGRGEFSIALTLIRERLRDAGGDRAAILYYLKACAYSGINLHQAHEAAEKAASQIADANWKILFRVLAQYYAGDVEVTPQVLDLTSSPDPAVSQTARILLAEIAYSLHDGQRMLDLVQPLTENPRAVHLTIRAYAELGQLSKAQDVLRMQVPEQHPEFERLTAHLALKQFLADVPRSSASLPPDFLARCAALQAQFQRAINACSEDATRRRQELYANSGLIYTWANEDDRAIERLQAALRLDGNLPHPPLILSGIHIKRREFDEALSLTRLARRNADGLFHAITRADINIQLASFALEKRIPYEEADQLCTEVAESEGLPATFRERAQLMRVRILLRLGFPAEAARRVKEWSSPSGSDCHRLAMAMIAQFEDRHHDVVSIVEELEHIPTVDIQVRHEALLHKVAALFNIGLPHDAATTGERALAMGMGDEGAEMVLESYQRVPDVAAATALEDRLLAHKGSEAIAWRSRRNRALQRGDLAGGLAHALQLATITGSPSDIYNAAAISWNLGAEDQAADLILPVVHAMTTPAGVELAARSLAYRGRWREAASFVIAYAEDHQGSREALRVAVVTCLRAQHHFKFPDGLRDRADALFEAAAKTGQYQPIVTLATFDEQLMFHQFVESQRARQVVYRRFQQERLASFQLAGAFGVTLAEAVMVIFRTPELHFHAGNVGIAPREAVRAFKQHFTAVILDLPSIMLLSRIGLLPQLAKNWELRVSVEQLLDIREYRQQLDDLIAGSEAGHMDEMTTEGRRPARSEPLRDERLIIQGVLDDIHRHCQPFNPDVHSEGGNPPLLGPAGSMLRLMHHRLKPGETLVLGESQLNRHYGTALNTFLAIAQEVDSHGQNGYMEAALRAIALGTHRLSTSYQIIDYALRRDGDRIGPATKLALTHLRNGGWFRRPLFYMVGFILLMWARERTRALTPALPAALSGILHGRTLSAEQRRKVMRRLPGLVMTVVRGEDAQVRQRAEWLLSVTLRMAGSRDLFADDPTMPNRHRASFIKPERIDL